MSTDSKRAGSNSVLPFPAFPVLTGTSKQPRTIHEEVQPESWLMFWYS